MTMHYFDGFDVYGYTSDPIADELSGRGWYLQDASCAMIASPFHDGVRVAPIGYAAHLTGTGYIQHDVHNWIDAAVGVNMSFDSIPVGGPYKLIELLQWNGAAYVAQYTLCVENGHFSCYSYGEVGVGALKDGDVNGTLVPNTLYTIHFYGRRSLKLVWINGVLSGYFGGYFGIDHTQAVRIYTIGTGVILDDFYTTYTQPTDWPGFYDTLYGMGYWQNSTFTPHYVLSPKPVTELLNQWTPSDAAQSLPALINDTDATYVSCNVMNTLKFGCKLEPVAFPSYHSTLHLQGNARMARTGSLPQQFWIEGRREDVTLSTTIGEEILRYFDTSTVAIGNGFIFAPIDFEHRVNIPKVFPFHRSLLGTSAGFNACDWYLRILFKPPVFTQGNSCPAIPCLARPWVYTGAGADGDGPWIPPAGPYDGWAGETCPDLFATP